MSLEQCALLRHPVRHRHGLGFPAVFCDCCGLIPIEPVAGPAPSARPHAVLPVTVARPGARRGAVAPLGRTVAA